MDKFSYSFDKIELFINTPEVNLVKELSEKLKQRIVLGVRADNMLYVYINGVEDCDGSSSLGISGDGYTYAEACEDYWYSLTHLKKDHFLKSSGKIFNLRGLV